VKELKDEKGTLISPRPKQKFGTDKIMAKIDDEHQRIYLASKLQPIHNNHDFVIHIVTVTAHIF
jgi:hypothetical protein